jgi:hypothetical protein
LRFGIGLLIWDPPFEFGSKLEGKTSINTKVLINTFVHFLRSSWFGLMGWTSAAAVLAPTRLFAILRPDAS